MPSSAIRQLDIAPESSYMSRGSNGEPDASGLDWEPCELADASAVVAIGTTQTLDYNTATGGFGHAIGEALVDPVSGAPVRTGTITIDWYLRGGITAANSGLRRLLSSRLLLQTNNASAVAVSVTTAGVASFTGATPVKGRPIAYALSDGRVTYGIASNTTGSSLPARTYASNISGSRGVAPASGGTVQLSQWVQPADGGDPIAFGTGTVVLRLTGDGWQQLCFGCALTALTITADGDGRAIRCSATVDCPYVVDVPSGSIDQPEWPDPNEGPVLHALGSPAVIGAAYYNEGSSTAPCVSTWSVSLTWTTAGAACGSYWAGRAPLEATALDTQVSITIGHPAEALRSILASYWQSGSKFGLELPFGGDVSAGASPRPWGGAIIIPNAYVTSGDVLIQDLSADAIQTTATLSAGQPSDSSIPLLSLVLF